MKLTHCPVCENDHINQILTAKDYLVSNEEFNIYQCDNCGLRFTNPRPDDNKLGSYYNSENYISHADEGNTLVNKLYKIARIFTLWSKRKLISKNSQQKSLLDVGCGTAHFLTYCQQNGWQISGVEPNDIAHKQAEEKTGITIHQELKEVTGQTFSVITLWHVLEHLPNLHETIDKLNDLMTIDSTLIIAVPNYKTYEESIFKENWAAYDVPRHLYHFNQKSIHLLMQKHGLKIVQTKPMWLDSFYISLLSNKQKYNRSKYIKSFITGLLSDIYALKTKNYSSLIYRIEKREE
jgi:2-polyprenyl-3-methyl-5-hydroxy-6-metoxy-1,4-benzoquinol methylase